MRGRYDMCPWEIEKWKQELEVILTRLTHNKKHQEQLTNYNLCPANVCTVLKQMGWTNEDVDTNGLDQDTWYTFSHPDYNFNLILFYEGYLFEMGLYRSDIDDDIDEEC